MRPTFPGGIRDDYFVTLRAHSIHSKDQTHSELCAAGTCVDSSRTVLKRRVYLLHGMHH